VTGGSLSGRAGLRAFTTWQAVIATLAKWIATEKTTNAAASHIATFMNLLMAMPVTPL
jgi:hypothetical protein